MDECGLTLPNIGPTNFVQIYFPATTGSLRKRYAMPDGTSEKPIFLTT